MSNITIGVASGLTGALLGGATVYILVKKHLEETIRAQAEQDIEEVRNYYKEKQNNHEDQTSKESQDSKVFKESKEERLTRTDPLGIGRNYSKLLTRYSGGATNVRTPEAPSSISEEAEVESEEEAEVESEEFDPREGETTSDVIRRVHGGGAIIADSSEAPEVGFLEISDAEWEENEWGFEKSSLRYFPEDDIVIDSSDIALPSPEITVGALGVQLMDEQDVTLLVNFDQEILLEITRDEGSYQEHIFGFRNHKDNMYKLPDGDKNE